MKIQSLIYASSLFFISNSYAQITVNNVLFEDEVIPRPTSGNFYINYRLFGSQTYRPQGFVEFYLQPVGSPMLYPIGTDTAALSCQRNGCIPTNNPSRHTVSGNNMSFDTKEHLNSLCRPTDYKVIARYNNSESISYNSAIIGQMGKPDWLFRSGVVSPNNLPLNGSVTIQYTVINGDCEHLGVEPAVGVFLTDESFNVHTYFGDVQIAGPYGSTHQIALNFDGLNLVAGNYKIVLFADVNNIHSESNEDNNLGAFSITLTDPQSSQYNLERQSPRTYIDTTPDEGFHLLGIDPNTQERVQGLEIIKTEPSIK